MIGKIRKGRSFSGCIRYVTQKDDAKIIASEGVLLGTVEETARSFRWQCLLNPDVAKPVGHIALSFKPEDAPRLTDAFMARLAEEYLELMGIRNTQFIVVRHHGTDNPHCHIVFNRVNFDGKVISDSNDFKRNEKVTKMLKDKYSLTYSEGKQSVKTEKLHASEKVKYKICLLYTSALRCLPLVLLLTGSSGSGGVSFLLASPDTSSATSPDGIIDSVTEASVPADSPGPGSIMSLSHHSSWPAPGLRPFFLSAVSDTAIFFPFVFSVGSLFIVHGF